MELLPPEPPKQVINRQLDDWINGYLEFVQHTEPPLMFHVWTAIGAISCVLERKCWLDWVDEIIYPNQYILLVSPPGLARKSTAINCARPFVEETMARMAPSSITGEAFIEVLIQSKKTESWGKGVGLDANFFDHSSAAFISGEMSNLVREGDMRMQRLMLELYDCPRVWEYATKHAAPAGVGDHKEDTDKRRRKIENACVNIIGATTPQWLIGNEDTKKAGKEGMYRRYMIVYERDRGKIVANPFLFQRDSQLKSNLINDIQIISSLSGPFTMDEGGLDAYVRFYTNQCEQESTGDLKLMQDDMLRGYVSCRATHLRKVAMVMSASRSQDMIITAEDIERALKIMEATERNMPRAFQMEHSSSTSDVVKQLRAYIDQNKSASRDRIWQAFYMTVDPYMIEKAMKVIEAMNVYDVTFKGSTAVYNVRKSEADGE